CGNLLRHFDRLRRSDPDIYPVVRLKPSGFNHKDERVGWVHTPSFVVVGHTAKKFGNSAGHQRRRRHERPKSLLAETDDMPKTIKWSETSNGLTSDAFKISWWADGSVSLYDRDGFWLNDYRNEEDAKAAAETRQEAG